MHRINLEGWKLKVAKRGLEDWTHQDLRLANDNDYVSTLSVANIPSKTLIMRSVILASNETEGPLDYVEECLIGLLLAQGYLDERSPNYREDICDFLCKLTPRALPQNASRQDVCAQLNDKMIANVFHSSTGSYLLRWGSFINHSCLPNTIVLFDSTSGEAEFMTLRQIQAGEEITICYFSWPINSRQARAKICQVLGFECRCVFCTKNLSLNRFLPLLEKAPSRQHCWWCGARDRSFRCRACDQATYCNKHCLREDREHKLICKDLYHCSWNACNGS